MQTTLTQVIVAPQPIIIPSLAWAWGFEDGAQGKSIYTGYDFFAGRNLTHYRQGWQAGRQAIIRRAMRRATVQHGDPAHTQWVAEGAPSTGFTFDGSYRGTPAEDRDDYVGM